MAFKRTKKETTKSSTSKGVSAPTKSGHDIVLSLTDTFSNFFEKTTTIKDKQLTDVEGLIDLLEETAKEIGFEEYSVDSISTFTWQVKESGSTFLDGPSLVSCGDSPTILWGNHRIPLTPDQEVNSSQWRYLPGIVENGFQRPSYFVLKRTGFRFPVRLQYLEDKAELQQRANDLQMIDTLQELIPHLQSGLKSTSPTELEENVDYRLHQLVAVVKKKNSEEFFGILEGENTSTGEAFRMFAPGELGYWENDIFPVTLKRRGFELEIITSSGEVSHISTGRKFIKLKNLRPSPFPYRVVGYEVREGKFGTQILLTVQVKPDSSKEDFFFPGEDTEVFVNGNSQINSNTDLLEEKAEITPSSPASLYVDSITPFGEGMRVNTRLQTAKFLEDPLLKKLREAQEESNPPDSWEESNKKGEEDYTGMVPVNLS